MKKALITGSAGLIGSESVRLFADRGYRVTGIDNDMRAYYFGAEASTRWNRELLEEQYPDNYLHRNCDIRDDSAVEEVFLTDGPFDLVIHTAAQPSHDWAAREPRTDFSVNALGTLIILESYRKHSSNAPFIFTSTNKVYGDRPNSLPLVEMETRYELPDGHPFHNGIDETMSIDDSKHSLFGASKVAADILVQEYGKYFGLPTGVFRGGGLTGPAHSSTQLHGFLAYLVKCIATGATYTLFGYKGKQVRDNIHSHDLVNMFWRFCETPRCGEVYNAGGSRHSNVSVLEAIDKIERILGKKANIEYIDQNRIGDHIWYISDVSKFKSHHPGWDLTHDTDQILEELCTHGHF